MCHRRSEYLPHDSSLAVNDWSLQIPDFEAMMKDVEACVKPSGVVIFIDGDTRAYLKDNVTPAPVAVDADEPGGPIEGSWFHRLGRGL